MKVGPWHLKQGTIRQLSEGFDGFDGNESILHFFMYLGQTYGTIYIWQCVCQLFREDKMLLTIKFFKWNGFQEQFSLSIWHHAKL